MKKNERKETAARKKVEREEAKNERELARLKKVAAATAAKAAKALLQKKGSRRRYGMTNAIRSVYFKFTYMSYIII